MEPDQIWETGRFGFLSYVRPARLDLWDRICIFTSGYHDENKHCSGDRDGYDEAVGIVTERDVMNRVYKARKDPFTVMVKDIMSSPLEAIEFDDSLTEALQRMRQKDIRRLAVVRSNQLVGITTHRRVLEALMHLENG
jgi:CBS domain-containing protein